MGIIHSTNYSITKKLFNKAFIQKIWKLFIQNNYSFFWEIDYRPGLGCAELLIFGEIFTSAKSWPSGFANSGRSYSWLSAFPVPQADLFPQFFEFLWYPDIWGSSTGLCWGQTTGFQIRTRFWKPVCRVFCLAEGLIACIVTGNLCIPDCENRLSILMVAIIGFVSSSTFVTALK